MSKLYPLGIVGEQNYQAAIKRCSPGQAVNICHEVDNPHDGLALKVETADGQTIGYIPKSSWLRRAIHEEGRGAISTIKSIEAGTAGVLGVVISVALSHDDIEERVYETPTVKRARPKSRVKPSTDGVLVKLLRSLFK